MINMQKLAKKYNGDVTVKQSKTEVNVSFILKKNTGIAPVLFHLNILAAMLMASSIFAALPFLR